jgi:transitional endoplasmic reticulum ATPase
MTPRQRLVFITEDPEEFERRVTMASVDERDLTLGTLLASHPAASAVQLTEQDLRVPVVDLRIRAVHPSPDRPMFLPPGQRMWTAGAVAGDGAAPAAPRAGAGPGPDAVASAAPDGSGPDDSGPDGTVRDGAPDGTGHPVRISEREAVLLAHRQDIDRAASYLESGLSVLIQSEKLIVSHLAEEISARAGRRDITVKLDPTSGQRSGATAGLPGLTPSRRNELLDALLSSVTKAEPGDLVVVPHLDLLAGGSDATLNAEARELADALYESVGCVLLAFVDPSLSVPEVLASRFDVKLSVEFLRRLVLVGGKEVPVGRALVTREEADLFTGFDEIGLYKHIAGLNAVRLRHALRFAYHQNRPPDRRAGGDPDPEPEREPPKPTFKKLVAELRTFKARTSNSFEAPDVKFTAIGGYDDVKRQLLDALAIIGGAADLPEHLKTELVPRGFIFEGPPGTGKTLFAKAAASELGATILVVSGPEITDKYVGESERKIRDLFNEARRNAPSVVVFDEFDSIAARRSGNEDGGARAGNAIVAQLLTELDGFRPEVPVLIIGTTNRVDLIDDALLRPSRFRPLKIGLPELDARRQIAAYHAGHFEVKVSEELLDMIAMATDQFSGDDIRSLFRDARAGDLVGDRRPADAFRLGQLVGQLKRSRQQRQADRTEPRPAGTAQAGQRARLRDTPTGAVPHHSRPAEAGAGSPAGADARSGDGAHEEGTSGS